MVQKEIFGFFAILDTGYTSPRICFVTDEGDAEDIEELLQSADLDVDDLMNKQFIIRIQEDDK